MWYSVGQCSHTVAVSINKKYNPKTNIKNCNVEHQSAIGPKLTSLARKQLSDDGLGKYSTHDIELLRAQCAGAERGGWDWEANGAWEGGATAEGTRRAEEEEDWVTDKAGPRNGAYQWQLHPHIRNQIWNGTTSI